MIKSRIGWLFVTLALIPAMPLSGQHVNQSEIAAAAQIYGYNLAQGNWSYTPAPCSAIPGFVMLHYRRGYPDGAESNFTALVPRSFGHVHIVPVLYHGATPFVPAPGNPRNFVLFDSLAEPVMLTGPKHENRWLERASCYAEMTGGNDFLSASGAGPGIAGQPSPTVRVTIQGKTARVLFAERDSYHSYRMWDLLFNRNGKIKSAQTQEQSVYASKIARSEAPAVGPEVQSPGNIAAQPVTTEAEAAREAASQPARLSTAQAQQQASIESEQSLSAPVAPVSPSARSEPENTEVQSSDAKNRGAEASQPGWKLIVNPPQPLSKFVPNAPPPRSKTIPDPQ